ncbi:MAG: DUF1302 family protein [Bacteroidota bacterium]|nr:DUF1302 family protein [Bacteroidota bacterium]
MVRKIALLLTLTLMFCQLQAQENVSINGYVRNYTGVLTEEPNNFSIVQNTFDLNLEKRANKVAFKVNPYLYHYTDRNLEVGLREAYMDMYFNNFDIRLGKQQIIWGKAQGVFITDVVSPKDLREFLLPDFDEIRTGVTAVKFNFYKGSHSFEAVWTPVFTPTQMPADGSIWAPTMNFPVNPEWDYSNSEVSPSLENSEVFGRYSVMASAFDFELVGGYFYYDDPALHLNKEINPITMQLTGLTVSPEYHRVGMGGGSFSVPIGDMIIRGEGAYYSGRYFQTEDPAISDAAIEKDNLHYMAGLDYTIGGVRLSAQFIQEYIIDYEDGIYNDEMENTMTFLAKKDFFREKLWIELFSYIGLNNEDALIRPKVTYDFADGFEIQTGANIFIGNEGKFGQYDANDMLYWKIKYSF